MREKTGFKNSWDARLVTWTRLEEGTQGSRPPHVGLSRGTPGGASLPISSTYLRPRAHTWVGVWTPESKVGPVGRTGGGRTGQWAPARRSRWLGRRGAGRGRLSKLLRPFLLPQAPTTRACLPLAGQDSRAGGAAGGGGLFSQPAPHPMRAAPGDLELGLLPQRCPSSQRHRAAGE